MLMLKKHLLICFLKLKKTIIKNGLKNFINETGDIDANFINDLYDKAMNTPEVEQALRISKHWFETLILHSFMHSNHLAGDGKIYIQTGEANTIVQGNAIASALYDDGGPFKETLKNVFPNF